jgi:DNA invertase Pin-like site-specific DNA recombinase
MVENSRMTTPAVADFERELIIERTQAGQALARAQDKHMGRPPSTTPEQRSVMRRRLHAGETVTAVAKDFAVSRATVISIRDTPSARSLPASPKDANSDANPGSRHRRPALS